jgi:peptidyl-prolyl cis-trans isomerase C
MKKIMLSTGITLSLMWLTGCSDRQPADMLALLEGQPITAAQFQAYLKFKRIPEQDESRLDRVLDDYLQREALARAIEKASRLDVQLQQAELEEFRRQMLIGRYFESYLTDAVNDDSVRNFYSSHASQYEANSIQAAHILIRVDPRMSETERQAKLSAAHEAYSRVSGGEAFAEVARQVSEDSVSARKGGDLGWLREGAVDPEFSRRLFSMKPGEISEPFLTPFGFHVVKMLDGPQISKRPLEAVEGDIRYQLRNDAKQAETERLLKSVKLERKVNAK